MNEDFSDDDSGKGDDFFWADNPPADRPATMSWFYQALLESQKDVLIFSIDNAYRYVSFNSPFAAATKAAYGNDVKAGENMLAGVTRDDDRRRIKMNCDRALIGESHSTLEVYGDLNKHYYETRYQPVFTHEKRIVGVLVLSSDITSRMATERTIAELNKELEAFTYTVAHDLRAPLRIMNGYAGIVREDFGHLLNTEGNRLLDVISSNCHMMSLLIDGLLNFSRLGKLALHKEKVDMQSLAQEIVAQHEASDKERRATIRIGNMEPAQCDLDLMRQVFTNLVSNALKYSSKKENPVVEIGSENNEMETIYFVRDNGTGFDMKYAHKLFGVFQRLHGVGEFEGTGVGLAIVARIISRHGGRVWAQAEPGKGATFYFTLPPA